MCLAAKAHHSLHLVYSLGRSTLVRNRSIPSLVRSVRIRTRRRSALVSVFRWDNCVSTAYWSSHFVMQSRWTVYPKSSIIPWKGPPPLFLHLCSSTSVATVDCGAQPPIPPVDHRSSLSEVCCLSQHTVMNISKDIEVLDSSSKAPSKSHESKGNRRPGFCVSISGILK